MLPRHMNPYRRVIESAMRQLTPQSREETPLHYRRQWEEVIPELSTPGEVVQYLCEKDPVFHYIHHCTEHHASRVTENGDLFYLGLVTSKEQLVTIISYAITDNKLYINLIGQTYPFVCFLNIQGKSTLLH